MYSGIIIFGLLSIAVFFVYNLLRPALDRDLRKRKAYLPAPAQSFVQPVLLPAGWNSIAETTIANISLDYAWWKALGKLDQLHVAMMLSQKTLPVWAAYAASNDMVYKHSPTSPGSKLDFQLLSKALEALQLQSRQLFPGSSNAVLKQYYYHFVGPVIALQDGNWTPPYPVKKLFLSVYNILKSIMEQDNAAEIENFLAIAINQSLDCMDITKLHSKLEIAGFLQVYKNKL